MIRPPPRSILIPYTTLFRSTEDEIVWQEIFDPNVIDDSKFVNVVPQIKIKNWGEIGIQHPLA